MTTDLKIQEQLKNIASMHEKMVKESTPAPRTFNDLVFVKDTDLADKLGPPQEYLFYETFLTKEIGVIPKGEPCMIAAPGGTGKSFLALGCAISAASGVGWLDYKPKKPVKTIYIGAEDNQNTLGNRFYRLLRGMDVDKDPICFKNLKKNLALWGLKGQRLSLINNQGSPTQVYDDLKFKMEQEEDIGLIVLDPARSFMARDTEADNGAASEWKDLICAMTEISSRPTVLVTHHTNKSAIRGTGKDSVPAFDQSIVRGASALVDGFRWILSMQKLVLENERKIFMKITKSNFSESDVITEWKFNYDLGGIYEKINKKNDITKSLSSNSSLHNIISRKNEYVESSLDTGLIYSDHSI
ncbi:MAG: AAA family ATPase [Myxococcales bacterium]|nr:AAA family ATPase [Myxococcales bacterium]